MNITRHTRVGPELVEGPTLGNVPDEFFTLKALRNDARGALCNAFSVYGAFAS